MTLAFSDGPVVVYAGDARAVLRRLPAESVHCVVTSPPYWGLRDYGTAIWKGGDPGCDHIERRVTSRDGLAEWSAENARGGAHKAAGAPGIPYRGSCGKCGALSVDEQLGREPTPDQYVANMVTLFREVRRVLRSDGTLWLNLGDSYAGSWGAQSRGKETGEDTVRLEGRSPLNARRISEGAYQMGQSGTGSVKWTPGLKPKDLVGIPWRVAFALQADGWYLRSDIIWSKPNPMPESVTDRPTKAHEYLFLLTTAPRYFYDAEAVREPAQAANLHDMTGAGCKVPGQSQQTGNRRLGPLEGAHGTIGHDGNGMRMPGKWSNPAGRNKRSVWEIATQPYPDAHFATYPEELVIPCVEAGTSEYGCCPDCGAQWRRVVSTDYENPGNRSTNGPRSLSPRYETAGFAARLEKRTSTTGWEPGCDHGRDPIPCTVLDPFAGSGTTLAVARRLGRRSIGVELQDMYLPLVERRIAEAALPLLEAIDGTSAVSPHPQASPGARGTAAAADDSLTGEVAGG